MKIEEYFKGYTNSGKEDFEQLFEMLENAWKDEFSRLSADNAASQDAKQAEQKFKDVRQFRSGMLPQVQTPKANYKLQDLIDKVASGTDVRFSRPKAVQASILVKGVSIEVSSTSWARFHGEVYREIDKVLPLDILLHTYGKPLGLATSGDDFIRPFMIRPGLYVETNLSAIGTVKKIQKLLRDALNIKAKDVVFSL